MAEFVERKRAILQALDEATRDKSVKQSVDKRALDIISVINAHSDYYTTSSCSGRISIMANCPAEMNGRDKKKGGDWLFVSHDPIQTVTREWLNSAEVFGNVDRTTLTGNDAPENLAAVSIVHFKFEPFILHVEAATMEAAQAFLSVAMQCGYRNSGIGQSSGGRVVVAVRHTMKLEVPIALMRQNKLEMLVSDEYLLFLVRLSNEKFRDNFERMQLLRDTFASSRHKEQQLPTESKEERWRRKRAAGLQAQLTVKNGEGRSL